jgi:hypothetical protein
MKRIFCRGNITKNLKNYSFVLRHAQGNRIKINFGEVASLKTAKPQNVKFKTAKVPATAHCKCVTAFYGHDI